MKLSAQSISLPVLAGMGPATRAGWVHSAFSRGIYVLCRDMTWVSLQPVTAPMNPYAIATGPCEAFWDLWKSKTFLGAEPGDPVLLSRTRVSLGGRRIEIDIRPAKRWDPYLEPLTGRRDEASGPESPGWADLLAALTAPFEPGGTGSTAVTSHFLAVAACVRPGTAVVQPRGRPGHASGWQCALRTQAAGIVGDIERGLDSRDARLALDAVGRAVGLGSGLTPSGDDFVTGLLAAYHFFDYGDIFRMNLLRALGCIIHRTTLPSFFMLKAGLAGRYPEPLSALVRSMSGGTACDVAAAAASLAGLGACSGQDMLAGVISYVGIHAASRWAHAAH